MKKFSGYKVLLVSMGAMLLMVMKADAQQLLESAFDEDRALEQLSAMYERVASRQTDSGVYRENEIALTQSAVGELGGVRESNMAAIIAMFQDEARRNDRESLKAEYQSAEQRLSELYDRLTEDLVSDITRRDLLYQQQALLDELQAFQEALEHEETSFEDSLEQLAQMAEKQEQLAQHAEEQLSEQMQEAAEDIQNLDIDDAIEKQQDIVEQLREEIAAEMDFQNINSEFAQQMAEWQEMLGKLQEMRDQLEQSLADPMDMEQRQEMAMKMDEVARQKEEIAEEMMEAMMEMMQEHDQAAMEIVEQAIQQLQEEQQVVAEQMQQEQQLGQLPEEGEEPGEGESPTLQAGRNVGVRGAEGDWSASLPERERDALLSARQAGYASKLDEIVRRYFVNLAQ